MLRSTWIPMRMNCTGRDKQTVPGVECHGRFSFFLPDARTGQDMKCDRCRMEMPRVDPTRSIFGFVDRDFLVLRVWQHDLQKRCMRYDATLFLSGSWFCAKHA